jgi:hypothetical protein
MPDMILHKGTEFLADQNLQKAWPKAFSGVWKIKREERSWEKRPVRKWKKNSVWREQEIVSRGF